MSEGTEPLVFDDPEIEGLRHIRLNNPKKLNVLSSDQQEQIIEAILQARDATAVRCLAFSGEGRAFCAGNDIVGPSKPLSQYSQHQVKLQIGSGPIGLHKLITTIKDFPKPTVVLMQGFALGAGYDLATSCDIRVATTDCKIGDPRVHRALWAAEGWSYKITRLIPQAHAATMHFRGELLTGLRAREIGLVHRIYNSDTDLLEQSADLLKYLVALPTDSFADAKRLLHMNLDRRFADSMGTSI